MPRCNVCDDLEYPKAISKGSAAAYRRLYASSDNLFDSAAEGCQACSLIRDAVLAFLPGIERSDTILITMCLQEYLQIEGDETVWYSPTPMPFITVTDQMASKYLAQIDLFREGPLRGTPPPPSIWKSIPFAARASGDTSSDTSMTKIENWHTTCTTQHRCGDHSNNNGRGTRPRLPKRIIDVGTTSAPCVRLHLSTEEEYSQYLCLSHCWGKSLLIRTVGSKLNDFVQEIPWPSLSKTFQQAIQVTRKLGFRYIWIDSLCIVQDSVEDWRVESGKMADYYGHAELTLAATMSNNGDGGLFTTNEEHEVQPSITSDGVGAIYARRHVRHFGYASKAWRRFPQLKTMDQSDIFPLLRRGWVYQERLLSPRMVHFSADELVWECLVLRGCECHRVSASQSGDWSADDALLDHPKLTRSRQRIGTYFDLIPNIWRFVVMRYTELDLTFGTDKLAALQGCAAAHLSTPGAEISLQEPEAEQAYVAGLWRLSVFDDLLWHSNHLLPRPQQWRAPSFSWASIDGSVVYPAHLAHLTSERFAPSVIRCQLLEAYSDTVAGELGPVQKAYLRVSGVLVTGTLRYSASSLLPEDDLDIDAVTNETSAAGDPYSISAGDESFVFGADYALSTAGPHQVRPGSRIHALRISQRLDDDGQSNSDGIDFSLVLRLLDGAKQTYERIGLLDIITRPMLERAEKELFRGKTDQTEITIV